MTVTLDYDAAAGLGVEASERFPCFGSHAAVYVIGAEPNRSAAEAVSETKRRLLHWNQRLSRFVADSELCRLNADPRSAGARCASTAPTTRSAGRRA